MNNRTTNNRTINVKNDNYLTPPRLLCIVEHSLTLSTKAVRPEKRFKQVVSEFELKRITSQNEISSDTALKALLVAYQCDTPNITISIRCCKIDGNKNFDISELF